MILLIRLYVDWLRYIWSTWYYRKSPLLFEVDRKIESLEDIQSFAKELYEQNFRWTADDFTQFFDSMDTPANCYKRMTMSGVLQDDCDGFAAAIYWLLDQNRIDCRLFNIITNKITDSHTVVVFYWCNAFYYIDYDKMEGPFLRKHELVSWSKLKSYSDINKKYRYTCFSIWDGNAWQADDGWLK